MLVWQLVLIVISNLNPNFLSLFGSHIALIALLCSTMTKPYLRVIPLSSSHPSHKKSHQLLFPFSPNSYVIYTSQTSKPKDHRLFNSSILAHLRCRHSLPNASSSFLILEPERRHSSKRMLQLCLLQHLCP